MPYIANNPAAKSVIIDVLAGLGLRVGDADDVRNEVDLDAMVAVRRSGAVNVVGLNTDADDVITEHGDFIAFKSSVAGATFGVSTINGFPVLVCS